MFFAVLLINLMTPGGLVQQTLGDPPQVILPSSTLPAELHSTTPRPAIGDEWPFGPDFVADTLIETHETLFGPTDPIQHTAFYPVDSVITGVGFDTGVNNVGQPFALEVIRFYNIEDIPAGSTGKAVVLPAGTSGGVLWGTLSTSMGAVNMIGLYFAWPPRAGHDLEMLSPSHPNQGIIPIINHDRLMDAYLLDDPDFDPAFEFSMMHEDGTGICDDETKIPICAACPLAGGIWCPCNDPAVQLAKAALNDCLAEASIDFAIQLAVAIAGLAAATKYCLATATVSHICLAGALAAWVMAWMALLAHYANRVAFCWRAYQRAFNAALTAACNPN